MSNFDINKVNIVLSDKILIDIISEFCLRKKIHHTIIEQIPKEQHNSI